MKKSPIQLDTNICVACKLCESDCPSHAINIDKSRISAHCIACGHCVAICPHAAMSFKGKPSISLSHNTIQPDMFQTLSAHTRSTRQFTEQEISKEILENLIMHLAQCPSSSNNRSLEVCVVTNKETIKNINDRTAAVLLQFFKKINRPLSKLITSFFLEATEKKKLAYYAHSFEKKVAKQTPCITYNAPAILIFHAKERKTHNSQADAYIWSSYTSLYARTYGIGSCFNGFIVQADKQSKEIRTLCNIPENHRMYAALLLGYPSHTYSYEVMRDAPAYTILE